MSYVTLASGARGDARAVTTNTGRTILLRKDNKVGPEKVSPAELQGLFASYPDLVEEVKMEKPVKKEKQADGN